MGDPGGWVASPPLSRVIGPSSHNSIETVTAHDSEYTSANSQRESGRKATPIVPRNGESSIRLTRQIRRVVVSLCVRYIILIAMTTVVFSDVEDMFAMKTTATPWAVAVVYSGIGPKPAAFFRYVFHSWYDPNFLMTVETNPGPIINRATQNVDIEDLGLYLELVVEPSVHPSECDSNFLVCIELNPGPGPKDNGKDKDKKSSAKGQGRKKRNDGKNGDLKRAISDVHAQLSSDPTSLRIAELEKQLKLLRLEKQFAVEEHAETIESDAATKTLNASMAFIRAEQELATLVAPAKDPELKDKQRDFVFKTEILSQNLSEVLEVADNTFTSCAGLLESGSVMGMSRFLPNNWAPLSRTYSSGPSYFRSVLSKDLSGWESSILISEIPTSKVNYKLEASPAMGYAICATSALVTKCVQPKLDWQGVKTFAGICAVGGIANTVLEWQTYVTRVQFRAVAVDSQDFVEDFRDTPDRESSTRLCDRVVKLLPFVVCYLIDGSVVLSFDPQTAQLWTWSNSTVGYLLGAIATDENRRFKPLYVSERMYLTSINRRTLLVNQYDKARAIERMNKMLENNDRICENARTFVYTAQSLYVDTFRMAAAQLSQDPYTPAKDF